MCIGLLVTVIQCSSRCESQFSMYGAMYYKKTPFEAGLTTWFRGVLHSSQTLLTEEVLSTAHIKYGDTYTHKLTLLHTIFGLWLYCDYAFTMIYFKYLSLH